MGGVWGLDDWGWGVGSSAASAARSTPLRAEQSDLYVSIGSACSLFHPQTAVDPPSSLIDPAVGFVRDRSICDGGAGPAPAALFCHRPIDVNLQIRRWRQKMSYNYYKKRMTAVENKVSLVGMDGSIIC